MIKKVLRTIRNKKLLKMGDVVIVGFSGGADSLSMLHILNALKDELGIEIFSAHLNHKFRPIAAEEDAAFAKNISKSMNIEHFHREIDCNEMVKALGISSEDAGRRARYSFFKDVADELGKKGYRKEQIKIAIAQNADDQSETILFRIMRGSGVDGICGMDYISVNKWANTVIRPILDISREEIERYCIENNLEPRIDATNMERVYTRNKIRLDLIPYIQRGFNENFKSAILNLGELAREDSKYIWKIADEVYEDSLIYRAEDRIKLRQKNIANSDRAVMSRVVLKALKQLDAGENISISHIRGIEEIMDTQNGTKMLMLPQNTEISIGYGVVEIIKREKAASLPKLLINEINLEEIRENLTCKPKHAHGIFDVQKLKREFGDNFAFDIIEIRVRREKDFIRLKNTNGRKKIKDMFIDMKIPKNFRDNIPLVCIGSEVLMVLAGEYGTRYSGAYGVEEYSERAIMLEIEPFI